MSAPTDSSIPDNARRTIVPGEPGPPPEPAPPLALDLNEPADRKKWLDVVRALTEDGMEAGLDASARKRCRVLSRVEARRKIKEARKDLRGLFDAAEPAEAPPVDPNGGPQ